jgi:hypothetical protein
MNRLLGIILICSLLVSCRSTESSAPPYKDFEFYYAGTWTESFSIRFTLTDSVYLRQHFASYRKLKGDTVFKAYTSYLSTLTPEVRSTLDSFIRHIDFAQYDTSYKDSNLKDGTAYGFYIKTDSLSKTIFIYGDNAPDELLNFGIWLSETKNKLHVVKLDTLISFKHALDWVLPPPILDSIKFTPPKFE